MARSVILTGGVNGSSWLSGVGGETSVSLVRGADDTLGALDGEVGTACQLGMYARSDTLTCGCCGPRPWKLHRR